MRAAGKGLHGLPRNLGLGKDLQSSVQNQRLVVFPGVLIIYTQLKKARIIAEQL